MCERSHITFAETGAMVKIAAIGDNVVDCYAARGEMFPGGNCLNLSVFARRFGAETAYVGAIGRDRAGEVIAAALRDEGVDVGHLHELDGPTAYCLIGHRGAERVFLSFDLGVSMFTPSAEDIAFLSGFSAVHVGQSSGLDAHIPLIAARAPLSYDFSIRREREHRRTIGPHCFLASVSGGDLAGAEVEAIAAELLESGSRWVLITRGREGARLFGSGLDLAVAAEPVEAIDTLGAGDSFIARTLFGLLGNEPPAVALQAAAREAAKTCLYYGAVGHGAPIDLGTRHAAGLPVSAHKR
jgi:fructoselysine 6-kinase